MTHAQQGVLSLGEPKVAAFGAVLRGVIKQTFGTNREFAASLGVSEGRVSQILKGAESITAQTLDQILACFASLSDRQVIHDAWIRTFAPAPMERLGERELQGYAVDLLSEVPQLLRIGRARQLLSEISSINDTGLDNEIKFNLYEAGAKISLFLQRPSRAVWCSRRMIELGEEADEARWAAHGHYTMANSSRTVPDLADKELVGFHEAAVQAVAALPRSDSEESPAGSLRTALRRDRALTALSLHSKSEPARACLESELSGLETLVDRATDEGSRALALEVKARLHIALKQPFAAEESIEMSLAACECNFPDFSAKASIALGRMLICRGEPEAANEVLVPALARCLEVDNLHHAGTIESLLFGAKV